MALVYRRLVHSCIPSPDELYYKTYIRYHQWKLKESARDPKILAEFPKSISTGRFRPENIGNHWNLEAVFRPILIGTHRKLTEIHRKKSGQFPVGILLPVPEISDVFLQDIAGFGGRNFRLGFAVILVELNDQKTKRISGDIGSSPVLVL